MTFYWNRLKCASIVLAVLWLGFSSLHAAFIPPYGMHFTQEMDACGNIFTLEDGSEWKVAECDCDTLYLWDLSYKSQAVTITPNYFSSFYDYYITNQQTGSYVRANLLGAPLRESPNALTIRGFDRNGRKAKAIFLSNRTFWKVHPSDLPLTCNWYEDDLVILGMNNDWLSIYTHILINIHTNSFVRILQL